MGESNLDPVLAEIHEELAKLALERLKSGKASAAEMTVALNLLKANGISRPIAPDPKDKADPLTQLSDLTSGEKLPFPSPDRAIKDQL